MGKHMYSVTCPACNGVISANTQPELITLVQAHAKEHHQMDLSAEKVMEMAAAMTGKQ